MKHLLIYVNIGIWEYNFAQVVIPSARTFLPKGPKFHLSDARVTASPHSLQQQCSCCSPCHPEQAHKTNHMTFLAPEATGVLSPQSYPHGNSE